MPRRAIPSTSLLRAVRSYFDLQQFELAAYLGISPELVKHIEAGRRTLTSTVLVRLLPLAALVPAAGSELAVLPPTHLGLPVPAPGPLEARRDYCLHKASQLRRELARLEAEIDLASRWQQALPALLAASDTAWHPERTQAWLLRRPAAPPDAALAAHYHLLRLQAEALDAEAAALAALLAPAS